MIKLDVAPYCHNCSSFEPMVIKNKLLSPYPYKQFLECIVICKKDAKCKALYDHIKNTEVKNG